MSFAEARDIVARTTRQADQVRATLRDGGHEGDGLLRSMFQSWERAQLGGGGPDWGGRYSDILLDYASLQRRLDRHFRKPAEVQREQG